MLGNIFPSSAFHVGQPRTIVAAHPRGPNETELWRVFLVDKAAPPAVKDFLRRYYISYAGPAGMTEQDDMENWAYATEGLPWHPAARCSSTMARRSGSRIRNHLHSRPSERPVLERAERYASCYTRWRQFMDAESWDDLRFEDAR